MLLQALLFTSQAIEPIYALEKGLGGAAFTARLVEYRQPHVSHAPQSSFLGYWRRKDSTLKRLLYWQSLFGDVVSIGARVPTSSDK